MLGTSYNNTSLPLGNGASYNHFASSKISAVWGPALKVYSRGGEPVARIKTFVIHVTTQRRLRRETPRQAGT